MIAPQGDELADWVGSFTNYDDHEWNTGYTFSTPSSYGSSVSSYERSNTGYTVSTPSSYCSSVSSYDEEVTPEVGDIGKEVLGMGELCEDEDVEFETVASHEDSEDEEFEVESDEDSEDEESSVREASPEPEKAAKPATRSPPLKSASISKAPVKTRAPAKKRAPAKTRAPIKKGGSWSDAEHNAIHRSLVVLRQWETNRGVLGPKGLRDVALWSHISKSLKEVFDVERSPSACKNYWSRYGRLRSRFEERAVPTGSLVTSAQTPTQPSTQTSSQTSTQTSSH